MKKPLLPAAIIMFVLLIASCALAPFMADAFTHDVESVLKVDTTGAKAVAGIKSLSRSSTAGVETKALEDNPVLVKFLEDGVIESVLESDAGGVPPISFITTGEDGSIYVGFEYGLSVLTGLSSESIQFIRIYNESTDYDVLWPPAGSGDGADPGFISLWGWWGFEQDPLVKGADGKLYFKVESWTSGGTSHKIYCYNPDNVGSKPELVTPENANLMINTFMIDSKKHLFFQGENESGTYLRYYTDGSESYKNIYYSSDQDTWVRGYVTSPNGSFIVMNGCNIRGMNGIIKVKDLENEIPTYELMYSNASSNSWFQLYKDYYNNWENNTELIDMTNSMGTAASSYVWREDVKTVGSVDINKIIAKISPYYYDPPAIKDAAAEVFVTGDLDVSDGTHALYEYLVWYPELFLETYFTGTLFKDWLTDNSMSDLYFDNIGSMLWASDGSLYGLYDSYWWGGSDPTGTKVVKLLDSDGSRDLAVISLVHGSEKPSLIKMAGDYLYYRYAVMDAYGQESGLHQLARLNITTGVEQELLPVSLNGSIEIISYDFSSNNAEVYFVGANPKTNTIINGKVNIAAGTWEKIDTTLEFGNIRVIE